MATSIEFKNLNFQIVKEELEFEGIWEGFSYQNLVRRKHVFFNLFQVIHFKYRYKFD